MNTDSEGRYSTRLEEENKRLREQVKKLTALVEEVYRVFKAPTATGEWIKSHLEWIRIDLYKIVPQKIFTGARAKLFVDGVEIPFATDVAFSTSLTPTPGAMRTYLGGKKKNPRTPKR